MQLAKWQVFPRGISRALLTAALALGFVALTGGSAGDGAAPVEPPAAPGSLAPRLFQGRGGVLLTWLEKRELEDGAKRVELRLARWDGASWSDPRTVAAGERFFANWADVPAVVEGPGGTLVAHWLEKLGEKTYDYGVRLARSTDGGESWQPLGLLHDDETSAEHGFVSFVPLDDGVQAFWLDGRAMPQGGPMQLRTARLAAADGFRPGAGTVVDERVCECCSTDAALTSRGPVVAYRDRSAGEIRDVFVARADGDGWSAPRPVAEDGWEIHGCPVNGPAVAARGERVAVAWFTAAGGAARVRLAFSDDAGATFGEPFDVDAEAPLGRVDVALDDRGDALVSWLGTRGEAGEIRLRRVRRDGVLEEVRTVAVTSARRSAGVPRMIRHGDGVLVAWVDDTGPGRVRLTLLPDV